MPTVFGRRYVRPIEAVGTTEKIIGALILLLLAGIIAAYVVQVATDREYLFTAGPALDMPPEPPPAAPTVESPFPDPGVAGWRAPGRVERFTPEELYIKIDGQADACLQRHVVGLVCGTYEHESDRDRAIDVFWYEMGLAANAQAMYESERPPQATPVAVGTAGYQSGGAVFFWKGPIYAQVLSSRPDDSDAEIVLRIAERLAARQ
jgi:hypothetical protein